MLSKFIKKSSTNSHDKKTIHVERHVSEIADVLNVYMRDYNTISINAGAGTGKSTLIIERLTENHRIVLVSPNQATTEQFYMDSALINTTGKHYAGKQNQTENLSECRLISTTYNSLERVMEKLGHAVSQYVLVLDEVHLCVTADYRSSVVSFVAENKHKFKNVLQLTATNVKSEQFKPNLTINVIPNQFDTIYKPIVIYTGKNKINTVLQADLTKVFKSNPTNKVMIYLNDTDLDKELGTLIKNLKLWFPNKSVGAINSKTKPTEEHQSLVTSGQLPYDITICTSLMTEGFSIKNRENITIYFKGFWSPEDYVQSAARCRKAAEIDVKVFETDSVKTEPIPKRDFDDYKEETEVLYNFLSAAMKAFLEYRSKKGLHYLKELNLGKGGIFDNFDIANGEVVLNKTKLENNYYKELLQYYRIKDNFFERVHELLSDTGMNKFWKDLDAEVYEEKIKIDSKQAKAEKEIMLEANKALEEKKENILKHISSFNEIDLDEAINQSIFLGKQTDLTTMHLLKSVKNILRASPDSNISDICTYIKDNDITINQSQVIKLRNTLFSIAADPTHILSSSIIALLEFVKIGQRYNRESKRKLFETYLSDAAKNGDLNPKNVKAIDDLFKALFVYNSEQDSASRERYDTVVDFHSFMKF